MKRPLILALLLVVADQGTKTLASYTLAGQRIEWLPGWGLTYTLNPGLWIHKGLDPRWFPLLQVLYLLVLVLGAGCLAYYQQSFRRSIWVDLAYAFLLAAVLGNLYLDRWWVGGARDFLLMPWFVANLADCYGNATLIALAVEFSTHPPARRLLRWTELRQTGEDLRSLLRWMWQRRPSA